MRLGRLLIILAVVLIVGLGLALLVVELTGGDGADETSQQTVDIVYVQQPIARGAIITEDALDFLAIPRSEAVEGMFTEISAVVGMRAKFDLDPPVPLTNSMVVGDAGALSETGSDAALLIPPGMVAVPIPMDRFSGVAYGLSSGDHVNVIVTALFVDLDEDFQTELPNLTAAVIAPGPSALVTTETEDAPYGARLEDASNLTAQVASGGTVSAQGRSEVDTVLNMPFYVVPSELTQRPRLVSQSLLQDIVVLQVGDFSSTGDQGDAEGATAPPDIITLIVSPQDAVVLNYLVYSGTKLSLALRSSGDDSRVFTEPVTLDYLMDLYNIPAPEKLPYGFEPRVDDLSTTDPADQQ